MPKDKHPQPKKVKVYNSTAFGPASPGSTPILEYAGNGNEGPGITNLQDKWVLSLVDDNNAARNATIEQGLSRNGIIGTFQKLLTGSETPIEFYDHSF